eukprot:190019-Amorphochlora_amoeboformis.AAC.1
MLGFIGLDPVHRHFVPVGEPWVGQHWGVPLAELDQGTEGLAVHHGSDGHVELFGQRKVALTCSNRDNDIEVAPDDSLCVLLRLASRPVADLHTALKADKAVADGALEV